MNPHLTELEAIQAQLEQLVAAMVLAKTPGTKHVAKALGHLLVAVAQTKLDHEAVACA
jgi:hypothetical protein